MPAFTDDVLNVQRFKLVSYHKYRLADNSVNPKVDQNSRWLMDLKSPANQNFAKAVSAFGEMLAGAAVQLFDAGQPLQVAIVPSHTAGQCSEGMLQVAGFLSRYFDVRCSTNFLYRHTTVPALKEGGNREQAVHLNSIQVQEAIDPAVRMLVIDDVSTTGNSLLACRVLLHRAGAPVVAIMALGQTEDELAITY